MTIVPLHEVRDQEKVDTLITSMAANGWQGRPILCLDCGDYLQALTGTHRLAAAFELGIDVPRHVITQGVLTDDNDEVADQFYELTKWSGDEERLTVLQTLHGMGCVDYYAVELMQAELA